MSLAKTLISVCFSNAVLFSRLMKTEGIGLSYKCWYLNQLVKIESTLSEEQMKFALKSLEKQIGRKKHPHNVAIDLDLVEIDGIIVHKDYNKYPFLAELKQELITNE